MAQMQRSEVSDAELLRRTAGGDAAAFGTFYDRHEKGLLRYLRRVTGRSDLAADLCAEVFAQALASAVGYRPDAGEARGWLFGIARHELADALARGRVEDRARRRLEIEALVLGETELARIDALAGDADDDALSLLTDLPADQRAAVAGRVLDERDYSELAASMDCSESVVRQRVSRGLRHLRSRLEPSP